MSTQHVIVLDEGTTSTRAVLFDDQSRVVTSSSQPLNIHTYPDGRVEQDADEIWSKSQIVISDIVDFAAKNGLDVTALGIATQRTTTVVWDSRTGKPCSPVISWQDSRTTNKVIELYPEWGDRTKQTTGLVLGAANMALHIEWILSEHPELRELAAQGVLRAGTPDTWLIWKLTGGSDDASFVTSTSCAGSAGPFDPSTKAWWAEFLNHLGVPLTMLPDVLAEDAVFGSTGVELVGAQLPITGVLGDQQSSLYGQGGFEAGAAKCTHGTGSFIDFNIGTAPVDPGPGLECRIGWTTGGSTTYVVEGSSFVTGSGVDWMVDEVGILRQAAQLDETYAQGDPHSGLVSVPALAGFAAPHWDSNARGMMIGFNRGTTSADIVRATLDGIAHTVVDVVEAMAEPAGTSPRILWNDGGLGRSDALLQAQADLFQASVIRADDPEFTTARGAAWCAGIATGVWANEAAALATKQEGTVFDPQMTERERALRRTAWQDAIQRALGWKRTVFTG